VGNDGLNVCIAPRRGGGDARRFIPAYRRACPFRGGLPYLRRFCRRRNFVRQCSRVVLADSPLKTELPGVLKGLIFRAPTRVRTASKFLSHRRSNLPSNIRQLVYHDITPYTSIFGRPKLPLSDLGLSEFCRQCFRLWIFRQLGGFSADSGILFSEFRRIWAVGRIRNIRVDSVRIEFIADICGVRSGNAVKNSKGLPSAQCARP